MNPNILLIISDEHSPFTMGCYGADFAQTPNLDRLVAEGTLFENAYCNFALCVPSRNAFMSGLQCHKIKAYDNGAPLASDLPTWAHMLTANDYRTQLTGKMHFLGPDQLHGFQKHTNEHAAQIAGFRWGEEVGDGTAYVHFSKLHIVDSPADHGFWQQELGIRDTAVKFLDDPPTDQPFCLTVGINYPHYPQVCDRKVYESYDGVDIPDPIPAENLHPRNDFFGNTVWGCDKMTAEEHRAGRQVYLSMVTMLDQWVGDILDALDRSGQRDNTIIIYTSDHGDMWGNHGLWGKNYFYEDSSHVPLIVSGPAFGIEAGRRIATPVSLLDLYPTMRDAGGIDWDVPLDGRSLWPALTQGKTLEDVPVYCEYYASDVKGPERMVRYQQYKLNYYDQQGMELFDLAKDPHELSNEIDNPDYADVRQDLLAMLMDGWDPEAIAADIRVEQNRRTLLGQAVKKSRQAGYVDAI